MNDIEKYISIMNDIESEVKNVLQKIADNSSPQQLMIRPELLDCLSKCKIERRYK